ncbi:MAG: pyridoxamine 5'-phosphate oxidase [Rickettsiales bacterium]|nr:pyridoxamine 5'-phosphate oxidase [Rickettsiales bacterium]|tara:strand:- start:2434 stop:3018 length:585 start_codon:yes stop_codon:yes gene_type:complete
MTPEILAEFDSWLQEARDHGAIHEPTAMCLSTCGSDGQPAGRIVLLKHHNERGFVFFSNHETSYKADDLATNPHAALCFYWMPLTKQIRIEGRVEKIADEEADAYFASRPRGSQIGAWASQQSRELKDRATFEEIILANEQKFAGRDVPRPPYWSGWRVVPHRIEFWKERDSRLHDRWEYTLDDGVWDRRLLYP